MKSQFKGEFVKVKKYSKLTKKLIVVSSQMNQIMNAFGKMKLESV